MAVRVPKYSIILAGGKGERMGSSDRHKVCFPIDGQPAINLAIEVYKSCGVERFVVVVGDRAEQVMSTVSREHKGVMFTYQAEQMGTADAARVGMSVLTGAGEDEEVLVVAGDKHIEPPVLEELFDVFYSNNCDFAYVLADKEPESGPGRVVYDHDGVMLGNAELADIRQRKILGDLRSAAEKGSAVESAKFIRLIEEYFSREKAEKIFGSLWDKLNRKQTGLSSREVLKLIPMKKTGFSFVRGDGSPVIVTPERAEKDSLANISVYLIKIGALEYALSRLDRDNAQQEEYLSDIVTILARGDKGRNFVIETVLLKEERHVMGFNNPEELLEIEEYIQSKRSRAIPPLPETLYRSTAEWREAFLSLAEDRSADKDLRDELSTFFGDDKPTIDEHIREYLKVLEFSEKIGGIENRLILVRSPGRVNLMGRHIDHQGGSSHFMTVGYETVLAAHPRDDDRIFLWNTDEERYPHSSFSIGSLIEDLPWDDWLSLVESDKAGRMVREASGDWAQYVKAAALRLQKKFTSTRLHGADMMVHGNIPTAAGLGSSTALVVAAAEALVVINRLNTFPSQFVDLSSEGEWVTGTREGRSDHAVIKHGRKGKVTEVGFFDFTIKTTTSFPDDHILAVCDSGKRIKKDSRTGNLLNNRMICYRAGFELIKLALPQFRPLLRHLRDVNTRTMGITLSDIYKALLRLPENADQTDLKKMLPLEIFEDIFNTQTNFPPEKYPIRGVVLYGLSECERSRLFPLLLTKNKLAEIGKMMNVSHNGDRITALSEDGNMVLYHSPVSNTYLLDLIDDLESEDPRRVRQSQLQWQPGSYRSSIPEIDRMVDIAGGTRGVEGAQITGAGLGGCMMALIHGDQAELLAESLNSGYYGPNGITPSVLLCRPVAGSGVLMERDTRRV